MSEPTQIPPNRRTRRAAKKIKLTEDTKPELPKELQDKWASVQACATAFNVMDNGSFNHKYMSVLKASLAFLQKLHEQAVTDILKHPDAHLIPELKAELDKEKEAQNGEKN